MEDKKMDIKIVLEIAGDSVTTNEFKINNAPKAVVIELEKLLIESLSKFMATHSN